MIPALCIAIDDFELTIAVEKNHGKPKHINKSNMLLPIEFDMAMSAVPRLVIIIVAIILSNRSYGLNFLLITLRHEILTQEDLCQMPKSLNLPRCQVFQ